MLLVSFLCEYFNKFSKVTFINLIHFFFLNNQYIRNFWQLHMLFWTSLEPCHKLTFWFFFFPLIHDVINIYLYIPTLEVYFFFEWVWIFCQDPGKISKNSFTWILCISSFLLSLSFVLLWHYFHMSFWKLQACTVEMNHQLYIEYRWLPMSVTWKAE